MRLLTRARRERDRLSGVPGTITRSSQLYNKRTYSHCVASTAWRWSASTSQDLRRKRERDRIHTAIKCDERGVASDTDLGMDVSCGSGP